MLFWKGSKMRYQLVPWGTGPNIYTQDAMRCVSWVDGAKHPIITYPMKTDENGNVWKGTNQPPVLAFSAPSIEIAWNVRIAYGEERCFLEERATAKRV